MPAVGILGGMLTVWLVWLAWSCGIGGTKLGKYWAWEDIIEREAEAEDEVEVEDEVEDEAEGEAEVEDEVEDGVEDEVGLGDGPKPCRGSTKGGALTAGV